jgi:hypothetical protein
MTFLINIFFWLLSGLLKYQSSTEQNTPLVHLYLLVKRCGSHPTIKNGSIHSRRAEEVNNKLAAIPRQVKVSDKQKGKLVRECDEMLTRSAVGLSVRQKLHAEVSPSKPDLAAEA